MLSLCDAATVHIGHFHPRPLGRLAMLSNFLTIMHTHPLSPLHTSNLRGLSGQDIGVTSINDGEGTASEEFTASSAQLDLHNGEVHVSKSHLRSNGSQKKPSKAFSQSKDQTFSQGLA